MKPFRWMKEVYGHLREPDGIAPLSRAIGSVQQRVLVSDTPAASNSLTRSLIDGAATVLAGNLKLVGLAEIKNRLGPRWVAIADRAHFVAEEEIQRYFSAGDIFRPLGEGAYLLYFDTDDEAFAEGKARCISQAISERLKSEVAELAENASVDFFVSPVDTSSLNSGSDPYAILHSSLQKIRSEALSAANLRHDAPTLRSARVLFQPMWPTSSFEIAKNRCLFDVSSASGAAKYMETVCDPEDLIVVRADLDCVMFTRSLEVLHATLGSKQLATIIVPVHFHTLARQEHRDSYSRLAKAVPEAYRKLIVVEVMGVPAGAGQGAIRHVLEAANVVSGKCLLQTSATDRRLTSLQDVLYGVSLNVAEVDIGSARGRLTVANFPAAASDKGFRSFAHGAASLGQAQAAVAAGFDYVGGAAIHPTVQEPRRHARFTPFFGLEVKTDAASGEGQSGLKPRRTEPATRSTQTELSGYLASAAAEPAVLDEDVGRTLRVLRTHLGMDVAFVSEINGGRRYFRHVDAEGETPVEVGGSDPLDEGYCKLVLDGRLPELIPDTAAVPAAMALPVTRALSIGAHLSVPIRMSDGRVYGTFCCFGYVANPSLNERDLQMMRAFADLTALRIERDLTSSAAREDRHALIRQIIDQKLFSMVYQPIFDFGENRVTGLECLARFAASPARSPDAWFAEAAEVGLGAELELATMAMGLTALSELPSRNYLSVNLSPAAIVNGDLAAALHGLPLNRIVLEITEHESISVYSEVAEKLQPLRRKGLRIAIDDVGAGYSSMRHILNLQPDYIKLDMTLTRDIDTDPARRSLALALIGFARDTKCRIIAEGVETQAELSTLRKLGVRKAQGYLIGRPMPLSSLKIVEQAKTG